MSKVTAKRQRKRRERYRAKPAEPRPMSDRAVYWGLAIIGLFFVLMAWLFTSGMYWREATLLYLAFVAYQLNLATWQIYRGRMPANWQQSLARIPLRSVGYGTKDGKPLEVAHDQPAVKNALVTSIGASVIILVLLGVVLFIVF